MAVSHETPLLLWKLWFHAVTTAAILKREGVRGSPRRTWENAGSRPRLQRFPGSGLEISTSNHLPPGLLLLEAREIHAGWKPRRWRERPPEPLQTGDGGSRSAVTTVEHFCPGVGEGGKQRLCLQELPGVAGELRRPLWALSQDQRHPSRYLMRTCLIAQGTPLRGTVETKTTL